MKRFISMLVVICLAAAMMPVAFAETVTDTIYSEDFESGEFTLVTNEENTVKELYKDGEATGWSFAKTNGKAFADFPESVILTDTRTNEPTNLTKVLDSGEYISSSIDQDVLCLNFPKITSGVVTIEYRMNFPASGKKRWFYVMADNIDGNVYDGDFVHSTEIYRTSSARRYRKNWNVYVDKDTKLTSGSYTNDNAKKQGFVYLRSIIDIDNHTVIPQYKTSESAEYTNVNDAENWYANGETGSYYMADSVAGLMFTANGQSYCIDDITITHTYEATSETPKAEVEGLTINTDDTVSSTATFNYLDTDIAPKTARLVTAFYKEDGQLITVKSDTKTVSAETTSATLTSPGIELPAETKYVKAFVWDFSTLKPYTMTETTIE